MTISPMPPQDKIVPSLRAIQLGDAEALCAMVNMPGFRHGTLRMPFERVEQWEKRIARSAAESTWIVAEVEGQIVGHGNLTTQSSIRRAHVGEIVLGVHDNFVGRGIGSAILDALLDVADNWRALKRVELTVYADNEPAVGLYTRRGFVAEGRHVKSAFRDGAYHDLLFLARLRF